MSVATGVSAIMGGGGTATAGGTAGAPALAASYPMASLYVGDLDPAVSEAMLFEKFSRAGPVLSIRVCRDAVSRRSLGYAYVNFQQPADAERALDTMNFDVLQGRPIRIMWSQRDPASRRSGVGNIFIKNLDKDIDNKAIYDTFSTFGQISSCKVAMDEEGNSRGYGFVHFETEDAAQKAIARVNGMLLQGKKVYVGPFLSRERRVRELGDSIKHFTNCYVKNLPDEVNSDEELKAMFDKFGPVLSAKLATDADGKKKGFGFVSFETPEHAEAAVNEMNGKEVGTYPPREKPANGNNNEDGEAADADEEQPAVKRLYVGRAQKKAERQTEMRRKAEAIKQEKMKQYQGVNLYVKNLDDDITDEELLRAFEPFGNITSCKVMCDESGRSKGFGFVCFERNDEATKAVTEMSNKVISKKPLYVALAQRKEDRKAQLASQYMQRLANMRMTGAGGAGAVFAPTPAGYFAAPAAPMARPAFLQYQPNAAAAYAQSAAAAAAARGQTPRWTHPAAAAAVQPTAVGYPRAIGGYGNQMMAAAQQQQQQLYGANRGGARMMGAPQTQMGLNRTAMGQQQNVAVSRMPTAQGMPYPMGMQQQPQPVSQQQNVQQRLGGATRGPAPAARAPPTGAQRPYDNYQAGVQMQRGGPMAQRMAPAQPNQALQVVGQPPLTPAELAAAPPQEQKQMLGERIYPLIEKMWSSNLAGKITGMLLEMDNSELLMMLTDEQLLRNKVEEAVSVLNAHNTDGASGDAGAAAAGPVAAVATAAT